MWSACSWDQRVRPRRRRRALRHVPYSAVLFAASCRSYRAHAHMEMALDRLSDAATFDHRPHHARALATDRNGPAAVLRVAAFDFSLRAKAAGESQKDRGWLDFSKSTGAAVSQERLVQCATQICTYL